MTIQNLIEEYYLHDSLITKITYENNTVKIELEFCYWLQKDYKEGEKETGMLEIAFFNVSHFDYGDVIGEIDYFSILETKHENDILYIDILDDFNDEYYTISLQANEVTVKEI